MLFDRQPTRLWRWSLLRMFFTASSQASVAAALANDRPEKTVAWRRSTGYSLDRRASQSMAYVVRGSERSAVYACRKTPHRRDGVEERVRNEVLLDQGLQLGLFERRPQTASAQCTPAYFFDPTHQPLLNPLGHQYLDARPPANLSLRRHARSSPRLLPPWARIFIFVCDLHLCPQASSSPARTHDLSTPPLVDASFTPPSSCLIAETSPTFHLAHAPLPHSHTLSSPRPLVPTHAIPFARSTSNILDLSSLRPPNSPRSSLFTPSTSHASTVPPST
ncbi:hypothetical protein HETIRDRAFT_108749 [Heterobasidion irregulare TC 32-1]|uniref:Uncharacterized protein n=1 Tax=Heterobasidion irregulare (strain TC 32-1) TaxID=747525 RepID=W4KAT4_HETIT|nr:uncharacterized protein HETIRDRAFT_108749 [Heterobasidion irregulare TC 32-1]ETW82475.1 hypothetical protein HETIRDRAFT_108749 [Heterobasidion irregulare TC 32-1]